MTSKKEAFYRFFSNSFLKIFYKIEFQGFDKIPESGPIIIIANHVSYLDAQLIQAAIKRPVRYMVYKKIYDLPIANYFMKINGSIPIDANKESVKCALDEISQGLEKGDAICIFPEGKITYNGVLGRFKPGIEWIIDRDPVPIYPVHISGLWGSMFSRKHIKSKIRWLPKGFRSKVKLKCGEVIHPGEVRINNLQRMVLSLKKFDL